MLPLFIFVLFWIFLSTFAAPSKGNPLYWGLFFAGLFLSIYLTLAAFFPGVYTNDSMDQLSQALTGKYSDGNPPIMAWFWSILIAITGRFESLMIFHLCLLTVGAIYWAHVFKRLHSEPFMLIIPILLLSPVIVNFSGVVWKDLGFAYTLLLASGIASVALLDQRMRLLHVLVAACTLTYAIGVRWNGIFSVIPIIGVIVWQALVTLKINISRRALVTASVITPFIFITIASLGLHYFYYDILKSGKEHLLQFTQIYDLAGISARSGKDYFPDFIKNRDTHNMPSISDAYKKSNHSVLPLVPGYPLITPPLIPLLTDPKQLIELRTSWLKAIRKEPVAYIQHRIYVFAGLMQGISLHETPPKSDDIRSAFRGTLPPNLLEKIKPKNIDFPGRHIAKNWISNIQVTAEGTFFYKGWFWLALLFTEFLVGIITYKKFLSGKILILLSTSGLLYVLPLCIVIHAPGFRYIYWGNIAASFAAIAFLADLINFLTHKRPNVLRNS